MLDPGLLSGAGGLAAALACGVAFRKHRARMVAWHAALRSEMESSLQAQFTEYEGRITRLAETVAGLERSAQSMDAAAKNGISRSARSQAMQLLRSGMSPENAASAVGIGAREMHLLAGVSRILMTK